MEKRKQQRKTNCCADYPGLAFGSAAFGSETMMKLVVQGVQDGLGTF